MDVRKVLANLQYRIQSTREGRPRSGGYDLPGYAIHSGNSSDRGRQVMLTKPRFVKCGSLYYNINIITLVDADRRLIWFLGESEGVDVSSEAIKTILKEIGK